VTRQTSLLALEPGMELLKDTNTTSVASGGQTGQKVTSDAVMIANPASTGGSNLNDVSLDDLIKGSSAIRESKGGLAALSEVSAVAVKGGVRISIPLSLKGNAVQLSMYTLQGRMILSKALSAAESGRASFVWNFGNTARMTKGYYILRIKTGLLEKSVSIPWM
jgi:hypothetical protein